VSEGIVDDNPEPHPRCQGQDVQQQQATDFIPVPDGLTEQAVGSGMVALLRLAGGFPNPADGAAPQTDNPGNGHETKRGVNLGTKGVGQRV